MNTVPKNTTVTSNAASSSSGTKRTSLNSSTSSDDDESNKADVTITVVTSNTSSEGLCKRPKYQEVSSSSSDAVVISLLDSDEDNDNANNDHAVRLITKESPTTSTVTLTSTTPPPSSVTRPPVVNPTPSLPSLSSSTFSVFRPIQEKRKLLFIRHGKTQGYHIIDTPLSTEGITQASQLLHNTPLLHHIDVLIVSPLSRSLQTAIYAFANSPYTLVSQRQWTRNTGSSSSSSSPLTTTKKCIPVYITPLVAERINTPGDLGRSPSQILQNFPDHLEPLREELSALRNDWWKQSNLVPVSSSTSGSTESKSNKNPSTWNYRFPPGEQIEKGNVFRHRIQMFRHFLHNLPTEYRKIGIIGHSVFIKEFTGQANHLHFCEHYRMNLE